MITEDTNMVALIDGDIVAYYSAAIADGEGPDELVTAIKRTISKWTSAAFCSKAIVFMSEGKNFRHGVYKPYKQNRKGKQKPPGVEWAKEWMLARYDQALSDPSLEADDRMGLYATEKRDDTEEVRVIVSTDKDMLTVPAWVFNPNKSLFPTLTTPLEATLNRYGQWVCGDSVDGFPGIKGFGPAKWAKYLVDNPLPTFLDICDLFDEHEYDREFALSQYLCATIKHNGLPEGHNTLSVSDLDGVC